MARLLRHNTRAFGSLPYRIASFPSNSRCRTTTSTPFRPRKCFASTRETIELLQAFSRIESPFLRGAIIKTAREAATIIAPTEPPKSTA